MDLLQIVLTVCVIGMFIFSISLIILVLKKLRILYRKKSIKPSSIDKMLFYETSPFAWRIGFTYSLLGYNQDQIDEFNDALIKVILAEKNMYRLSSRNYMSRLKNFIKRVEPKADMVSQITNYRNILSSKAILNETNSINELEYILSFEVDKFLNETAKAIRQEQIDRMEGPSEEPPF
tara:strand:- start:148 stop:681 length:534 start_codon:yes stop_codon:yes gene_type:complete